VVGKTLPTPELCRRVTYSEILTPTVVLVIHLEFKHLDVNIMKYYAGKVDQGALLSSSITFDDEDQDNCTAVVLGFHQFVREWASRLLERGDEVLICIIGGLNMLELDREESEDSDVDEYKGEAKQAEGDTGK
jgi:hypothetical protein